MLGFIDGYKTYIAGAAMIFGELATICTALTAEYFDIQEVWNGVMAISAGIGAMGFRHAMTKKEPAPPPE